jgi:hypothetical protein
VTHKGLLKLLLIFIKIMHYIFIIYIYIYIYIYMLKKNGFWATPLAGHQVPILFFYFLFVIIFLK